MTELSSAPAPALATLPEFTVSEIAAALKRAVEDGFGRVRVRGEVSGFKRAASGHLYLTLKDADAVLDAVCWRGVAQALAFQLEDGLEVVVTGRLTTYPQRSRYQIVIEAVEPAGAGALMALLEARRRALAAEGLFEEARKRPLPYLPEVIGVVTSLTGAVIRDILHRLADRFPRRVLVWPVAVQGAEAAAQVAAAISGFNAFRADGSVPRPDLLIVARGGGSLEDLWAFNEEVVVRAAAASAIPLIAAIGHETDWTLLDLAADLRAPTPTAAAEMAVPVRAELSLDILDLERRLGAAAARRLKAADTVLLAAVRGLRSPASLLEAAAQRLDDVAEDLSRALAGAMEARRGRVSEAAAGLQPGALKREVAAASRQLAELARRLPRVLGRRLADLDSAVASQTALLASLSYQRVLERGYAVVRNRCAGPVTSAAALHSGAEIDIGFHDGKLNATVDGAAKDAAAPRRAPRCRRVAERQGKLF